MPYEDDITREGDAKLSDQVNTLGSGSLQLTGDRYEFNKLQSRQS